MEKRDIITDRLLLIADILEHTPKMRDKLISALNQDEEQELLRLLDKLTDKAEELFCGSAEAPLEAAVPQPAEGEPPLGENEIICGDCELFCRVSWSGNGNAAGDFSGARCQCGIQAARQAIKERARKDQHEKRLSPN